jgi:hypothetical protein
MSKKLSFNTEVEAFEWLEQEVDDPCVDNYRFAHIDDEEAMMKYEQTREGGCCGFYDTEVIVNGKVAMIGCNYGH